jgi:CO/xanthine dehydrogenase Mo-binding subunit
MTAAIGLSWPRTDAGDKVTGRALYTADLGLPGMLHARILRSPLPHARLAGIDATRARRVPGVRAVLTRDELPADGGRARYGAILRDQGVVAIDRVRFIGDPVAAVAAADREAAEEALALIDVDYDELPAVLTAATALEAGAPILHPDRYEEEVPGAGPQWGSNVCGLTAIEQGEVEDAFAAAHDLLEEEYTTPPVHHCHLEPHATLAAWEGGRLTVWSCTQTPFVTRRQLARLHGLPVSGVRVVVPYIGGGYGGKTNLRLEPIVSHLARLAGRPVRLVLGHQEVFQVSSKHASRVRLRSGLARDGRIVARDVDVVLDTGAYADTGPQVAKKCTFTAGPYRIPNVRIRSRCVYTNLPPAGSFRGFGLQQMAWAYEGHMDALARRLGVDPLELRQRHLYREGDRYITGEPLRGVGFGQTLDAVAARIGWAQPPAPATIGRRRGRGLAMAMKGSFAPTTAAARVTMNEDGSVTVAAPTPEIGQGARTVLGQIAAEVLALPPGQVALAPLDTDAVPFDDGAIASRSTFTVGRAVHDAATEVRARVLALAADHLEAGVHDLVLEAGRVAVRGSDAGASIADVLRGRLGRGATLAAEARTRVSGGRRTDSGRVHDVTASFWFVAAGAAEVEVDEETGKITVLRYATAADVGRALNPRQCAMQIRGSAVIGLGQALGEHLQSDGGQLVNASFSDYRIPTVRDVPAALDVDLVEVPHPDGPFGAKGVGEVAVTPVAAAVAAAVRDAVGVVIRELPLTPERVLRALRDRRGADRGAPDPASGARVASAARR